MKGWRLRKNGILKENLFSALIISYIAIFVLSFVVGIAIITTSQNQARESIYDYNAVLVKKMKESINPIYDTVCDFSDTFGEGSALMRLIGSNSLSGNSYKELMPLITKLDSFGAKYEYVHDAFVYCRKANLIVGNSINSPEAFYEANSEYEGYTYEEWRKIFLDQKRYNTFYPVEKLNKSSERLKIVTFVNALYNDGEMIGTLVIRLDADEMLEDVFMEEVANGSSIYILDKLKQPIIAYGYTEGDIEAIPFIDTERKGYVENDDRVIVFTVSPKNRWMYAVALPERVMFEQLFPMKVYFTVIMLIYAISGAVILGLALRSNRKRMQIVFKKLGVKEHTKGAGMAVTDIVSSIDKLVANNAKLTDSVRGNEEYIKRNVLLNVLTGKIRSDCEQKLSDAGINFENNSLCIAVISIEDAGLLRGDESESLCRTCVINVFSEMVEKLGSCYVAEPDLKHMVFVLNPANEADFERNITELCAEFRTILSAEFEMTVEIGISSVEGENILLNKLYNEALIALDYKTAPGQSAVFYKDIIDGKELVEIYYYPYDVEEKIINCVRAGEEDQLTILLDTLIEKNIKTPSVMRRSKNCFYYDLLGTYMKAADLVGYDSERTHKLISKDDDNYISIKNSVSVLCDELINLCRFSHKLQEEGVDKTAEKIKKYVDDNYTDINLGVLTIADQFGISRQTASKKFSQAFDLKLNEYITDVRMQKAKELLTTTNLNGFQIAEMVGYADSSTFIRVFKKLYGVTPGQYKKNIMI